MVDASSRTIGDGLTLLELAVRGRWNVAAERAAHFPQEITQQNQDGLTALHLAVVNSPPAHLFARMLDNSQEFVPHACMTKDEPSGMTPLLCAAAFFAPLETMQQLVDACPEAVWVKDSFGSTCLHHVCSRARREYSSVRRALARAEVLLDAEPSLVRQMDDTGLTPLHVLCQEFQEDMQSYWLSSEPDVQLGMLRFDVDGLWLFFDTLLRYGDYSPSGNILHRIVSTPAPPLPLILFVCRRSPGIHLEQDALGNTPLHLAVQGKLYDVASLLVERLPECACILNQNGESALTLAARAFPSCNRCLRLVIRAWPGAVENVIPDEKLYSHLFAALLQDPNEGGAAAVFDILRRRPHLVDKSALLAAV